MDWNQERERRSEIRTSASAMTLLTGSKIQLRCKYLAGV